MNKGRLIIILAVIILLITAVVTVSFTAFTVNQTKEEPAVSNNTVQDSISVKISDGFIIINIAGDKYKNLSSYKVITNLNETEAVYDKSFPQKIPFTEGITYIKIIGNFPEGSVEIYSGDVMPETVVEHFNPKELKFTIKFDTDGGSKISDRIVSLNDKIQKPANPKRYGYEFKGWFIDSEPYDFNSFVMSNLTLTAKWEPKNISQNYSMNKVVYSINNWYFDKFGVVEILVLKNNKAVSFNGCSLLTLPKLPKRDLPNIKKSSVMTLTMNSANNLVSGSQIYIAEGGKLILDGEDLVFTVNEDDFYSVKNLIEIDNGGELQLLNGSKIIIVVV